MTDAEQKRAILLNGCGAKTDQLECTDLARNDFRCLANTRERSRASTHAVYSRFIRSFVLVVYVCRYGVGTHALYSRSFVLLVYTHASTHAVQVSAPPAFVSGNLT